MPRKFSDEQRAAMSEGRRQHRAVRLYLEALEATRPKRGRRNTPEMMRQRLANIDNEIAEAKPIVKLELVQERMNLENAIEAAAEVVDLSALENDFVAVAAQYSSRKGVRYAAWREVGVEAAILKRAGIGRGG